MCVCVWLCVCVWCVCERACVRACVRDGEIQERPSRESAVHFTYHAHHLSVVKLLTELFHRSYGGGRQGFVFLLFLPCTDLFCWTQYNRWWFKYTNNGNKGKTSTANVQHLETESFTGNERTEQIA